MIRAVLASALLLNGLSDAAAQVGATARIPPPKYPLAEWRQNHHGVVTIELAIDATGRLTDASISKSSGREGLDESALQAARLGSFEAARDADGNSIDSVSRVDITFSPPHGTPEENERQLRRTLDMTCTEYLQMLDSDPDSERDKGSRYTFGMPLMMFESLSASRGRVVELLPERERIYRKLRRRCESSPEMPAFDAFEKAVR
jgi:TonB family protein